MAEIVNLRRARKRKIQDEKNEKAAANRAKFGRRREERELTEATRLQEEQRFDGHKRDK